LDHFIQLLKSVNLQTQGALISFDVISPFTNVPVTEALQVISNKLHNDDTLVERSSFAGLSHYGGVGASHMSDNRQMSVAMQRLVDLISMVTNSTLLRNNTVTLLLAGFSVGRSIRNSPLLCNG
jgi:hypothetical protein